MSEREFIDGSISGAVLPTAIAASAAHKKHAATSNNCGVPVIAGGAPVPIVFGRAERERRVGGRIG